MLAEKFFWVVTIALSISAGCFIVPPIWLAAAKTQLCVRTRITATISLVLLLVSLSYCLYFKFGAPSYLPSYFSEHNTLQRANSKQVRHLYACIQRELVKYRLGVKLDIANVDLILNFAQIHSQAEHGILQPDVEQLLQAVLQAIPQQVTALNLLAISAYKTERYKLAISCWQSILEQFTPEMRNTFSEKTLQNKIIESKNKLRTYTNLHKSYESKQTN